jgi:membrane-bound lytic murein transglycosylase D
MKVQEAAKKVGMSESELRSVNKIPPRMVIKAGSALLVPRSARQEKDVSSKVADNGQLNLTPEVTIRKKTIKAHKKDSLASVAKRYKVTVADVAKWNNLSVNSNLESGQKLVLMLPSQSGGKAKKANQRNKG